MLHRYNGSDSRAIIQCETQSRPPLLNHPRIHPILTRNRSRLLLPLEILPPLLPNRRQEWPF